MSLQSPLPTLPLILLLAGLLTCVQVGCAPWNANSVAPLGDSANGMGGNMGKCHVLIERAWGKVQEKEVQITRPMTVQDVLVETGAIRRFRTMEITIERRVPGRSRPLRLPVTFEPRSNAVAVETDYAIYPDDRILITQDHTSPVDRFLEAIGGPAFK